MRDDWMGKHYSFFQNKSCEYFPCHHTEDPENFNCLFCYCPLYPLGEACGGAPRYTEKGVKDCHNCTFPHEKENFGRVVARFAEVAKLAAKREP